ncbi:hypothetical protein BDV38DRAFT_279630 [Aspergillus pseudotamarii]|uniref:O-methyltransferase domain-containing protein n=1 Tax=Aspergillus pseudotamarii TaxID=132259 RepID=A0A5N6T4H7_ASPPS|nr:uncharacterized protein BDV38DRAFT_279630 [Aspergillus pseudotamarii]KAE8141190.1 hypothetical protein BDV38DRAFT_279630 [Aspergillus pseudotamarii]
MESIIAQARSLAGEADGAGRAKIRDAIRQLLLELETLNDLLMDISTITGRLPPFVSVLNRGYSSHVPKARYLCRWNQVAEKTGASPQLFECILLYLASNGFGIEANHGKFKANRAIHTLVSQIAEAFIYHAFDNCGLDPKTDGVETMTHDIFQTQVVKGKSCIYTQNNCPSITPSPTDIQINPQGAKFYYLRRILHDYPDSHGIQILKNLRVAEFHVYDNSDNFSVIVMELR